MCRRNVGAAFLFDSFFFAPGVYKEKAGRESDKITSVGEGSPLPFIRKFYFAFRRRTSEPPLCKGRCRAKRGGRVVPNTNYLLCSANSTLLQSLRRCRASPLYTRGPFWSCEHCKKFSVGGILYAPVARSLISTTRRGQAPPYGVQNAGFKQREGKPLPYGN